MNTNDIMVPALKMSTLTKADVSNQDRNWKSNNCYTSYESNYRHSQHQQTELLETTLPDLSTDQLVKWWCTKKEQANNIGKCQADKWSET